MTRFKFSFLGHIMQRPISLTESIILGKVEEKRKRGHEYKVNSLNYSGNRSTAGISEESGCVVAKSQH